MCRNCGDCTAEHVERTLDDAVDEFESLDFKV
jgi:hypothetical protein